ncbi:MAG TPA: hypothetical protein VKG92_06070, partial [Flavobacteriales bacterium]|nr:hypothetical protein [Flavobacteriales bacterium]
IFAQKHFTRRGTDFFSLLINGSIYLSAAAAIVMRFLRRTLLPLLDALVLMGILCLLADRNVWDWPGPWPTLWVFARWTLPTIAVLALFGGYDKPVRLLRALLGSVIATVMVAYLIGMPEITGEWRHLVLGIWIIAPLAVRIALHLLRVHGYSLRDRERQRILAIGDPEEAKHALALLWQTHFGLGRQKQMDAAEANARDSVQQIRRKIRKHGIDEVVFCARDLKWGRIIELMEELRRSGAMFKIAQPAREFIIGPSSIESISDLHIMEQHAVHSAAGRRTKRIIDVAVALALLATLPLSIWFVRSKRGFLRNWWQVFGGRKSWVGYHPGYEGALKLPVIKRGILDPLIGSGPVADLVVSRVNITYAKDYRAWEDLRLVVRCFRSLGRN